MYIVVTRMEVFKSFGWLNISGRYAKDTTNSSFSKCPAMPLLRCLRNCSISLHSSNTSKHSNTGYPPHFCVEKNIVFIPNFVTKNFEHAVIEGMASDKVYSTHNNRKHILFLFSGRVSQKKFDGSYPLFQCFVPPRGTCTPVKNHCVKCFEHVQWPRLVSRFGEKVPESPLSWSISVIALLLCQVWLFHTSKKIQEFCSAVTQEYALVNANTEIMKYYAANQTYSGHFNELNLLLMRIDTMLLTSYGKRYFNAIF